MSDDKGYLQTITCSINLSSCRLRAESLARALNSKLWSERAVRLNTAKSSTDIYDSYLTIDSGQRVVRSKSCMANVIDRPPRTQMESFNASADKTIVKSHGWINELASEDGDEYYDTPPCSSPPSPADENEEIIVNPPTLNADHLPFCPKFLRDIKPEDAYSDSSKLKAKLQKYADGLLTPADEGTETFYDATEGDRSTEWNRNNTCQTVSSQDLNLISSECLTNGETDDLQQEHDQCSQSLENFLQSDNREHDTITIESNGELQESPTLIINVQPASPLTKSIPNIDNSDSPFLDKKNEPESNRMIAENRNLQKIKELEEEDRPKLLRTTSLKTGKTPPGTPGRKKIVRFADVLGLDLEAVRHIVSDDLPHVPSSAFNDLKLPPENMLSTAQNSNNIINSNWNTMSAISSTSPLSGLFPLFDAPISNPGFFSRVRKDWVSLEKVTVSDLSVHCVCCVLNASYEKTVTARYTTDEWQSFSEVTASYVPFSSDGEFDRFSFSLFLQPSQKHAKQRLCFAIRYNTKSSEHWDNNRGQNYILSFHGVEGNVTSLPTLEDESSWLHHFY